MSENPYLQQGRLAEVIGAITALGTYRYYKLTFAQCAERIANRPEDAERWKEILCDHPEFFRLNPQEEQASLVWRRQFPKRYDVRTHAEVEHSIYDSYSSDQKSQLSRRPLAPTEITALIGIAVNLHERALEQQKAGKWWVPIFGATLAFVGALLGASIGKR